MTNEQVIQKFFYTETSKTRNNSLSSFRIPTTGFPHSALKSYDLLIAKYFYLENIIVVLNKTKIINPNTNKVSITSVKHMNLLLSRGVGSTIITVDSVEELEKYNVK